MRQLITAAMFISALALPFHTYAHGGGCRKDRRQVNESTPVF